MHIYFAKRWENPLPKLLKPSKSICLSLKNNPKILLSLIPNLDLCDLNSFTLIQSFGHSEYNRVNLDQSLKYDLGVCNKVGREKSLPIDETIWLL